MSIGVIASQAFSPNKISGLLLNLDASDIGTIIESGGFVSRWNDKSGNGKDVRQIFPFDQPTTGMATINGLNTINFDGQSQHLTHTGSLGIAGSNAGTVFIVSRIGFLNVSSSVFSFGGIANSGGEGIGFDINSITGGSGFCFINGDREFIGDPWGLAAHISTWTWVDGATYNQHDLYVNSVLQLEDSSTNPSAVPSVQDEGFVVAAQDSAGGLIQLADIDIGQIIVYDRQLSIAERQNVEKHLFDKWLPVPAAISGLELWLDAADTATITASGGSVSQWDDKSDNGKDVTQGNGINQPTTGITTINGRNVISFNGLFQDFMTHTGSLGIAGSDAGTVIVVSRIESNTNQTNIVFSFGAVMNPGGLGKAFDINSQDGPSDNLHSGYRFNNGNRLFVGSPWGVEGHISTWPWPDGATYDQQDLYVNGILQTQDSSTNPSAVPNIQDEEIVIAAQRSSIGNIINIGRIDIGEIIVYSRELTTLERQTIEVFLSNKWGIDISFPIIFTEDFSSDFS